MRLQEQLLVDMAREVLKLAYAPYSSFFVGAALRTRTGRIFVGCNVENASYGLTLCAERVALCSAVASAQRNFSHVAIVTSRRRATPPCGACRQVLAEFNPRMIVLMEAEGKIRRARLSELLPMAFGGHGRVLGRHGK